jgi:PAS domain S-box-containing protein
MRFSRSGSFWLSSPLIVVAFLGVLMLGAGGWLVAEEIGNERASALTGAQTRAGNTARILGEHLHQTIRRIDQALLHLRDEYAADPEAFLILTKEWRQTVYADLAFQIAAIDADGMMLFSNHAKATAKVDLSDREHFRIHKTRGTDELFISKPVLGRVTQKWTIQFTRPLVKKDGVFSGVMVISIDVDHLSSFYRSVDVGREGVVALVGADRVIRARGAGGEQEAAGYPDKLIGQTVVDRSFFNTDAPPAGLIRFQSTLDTITRLGAYNRLSAYPLYVMVLFGEQEILGELAEHESETVAGAAAAGAFTILCLGVIIALIHRQNRDKRRLEEAHGKLAALEERWRLALEAVGDGVWDWDVASDDVYFSPRWKAMLGYGENELTERLDEWKSRIHPDDLDNVGADVGKLLAGENRFYTNEHRVKCRDGVYKWVLDRGVVVARDGRGQALRAVGTHTDITRRKEMEEALQAKSAALLRSNRELEAFAYVASHDLRQPLRTVNSYAVLLTRELGDAISADAKEFIGFIRDGAQRMDRLIIDLLEYSRVGRNPAPFVKLPADQTVRDALLNLTAALQESEATVEIAPDLPQIQGDESELIRLFQNIIGNAVKYRAADRPPVIRIDAQADENGFYCFAVRDNGVGIAPEDFERVFGIFQRLQTTAATAEGSGIGLAVCKKIVERHGGRIRLSSVPGMGSEFFFTLPAA